jgi:alpha-beta hydrolase superfamily lysophospholipase
MADYSQIDQSPLLGFLFYPRKDVTRCPAGAFDLGIPVEEGFSVACRFFGQEKTWPWILYFHGNGEVASDYDEIAPLFQKKEINLAVADYRGYGASSGSPNFTNLLQDSRRILRGVRQELARKDLGQDLWVMGRSMGSLAAVELAYHDADGLEGMVIESGFASVTRLIQHLRLPTRGLELEPIERERLNLIRKISLPALILHGEKDSLVPLQEGKALFSQLGSAKKELVIIPGADHNTILLAGRKQYFEAIAKFVHETK